ncbi:hypothetical protein KM043_002315 [Ampulex compressa]|nr:hypothetical protein KM043_002315 [Ampulex compressa]
MALAPCKFARPLRYSSPNGGWIIQSPSQRACAPRRPDPGTPEFPNSFLQTRLTHQREVCSHLENRRADEVTIRSVEVARNDARFQGAAARAWEGGRGRLEG